MNQIEKLNNTSGNTICIAARKYGDNQQYRDGFNAGAYWILNRLRYAIEKEQMKQKKQKNLKHKGVPPCRHTLYTQQ